MSTTRYPGYAITKISDTEYLMVRDAGIYAIRVCYEGETLGWMGAIQTRRKGVWGSYTAPWRHCVAGCIVEAERRAKTVKKYEGKPLAGAAR